MIGRRYDLEYTDVSHPTPNQEVGDVGGGETKRNLVCYRSLLAVSVLTLHPSPHDNSHSDQSMLFEMPNLHLYRLIYVFTQLVLALLRHIVDSKERGGIPCETFFFARCHG